MCGSPHVRARASLRLHSVRGNLDHVTKLETAEAAEAPKEEAKAAIKAMNGSEIKGRRIVVEESSSGGSSRNRGGRRKQSKR